MKMKGATIELRRVISQRNLLDTLYKDIRLAVQNFVSPKERVVKAEWSNFLSVIQGVGESDNHFVAPPRKNREQARYCDIKSFKTAANLEKIW